MQNRVRKPSILATITAVGTAVLLLLLAVISEQEEKNELVKLTLYFLLESAVLHVGNHNIHRSVR